MAQLQQFMPGEEEKVVIEDHELKNLESYPETADDKSSGALQKRREILDFGNEGFLLENLFSEDECKYYMSQGEILGLEEIKGMKKSYRNCLR